MTNRFHYISEGIAKTRGLLWFAYILAASAAFVSCSSSQDDLLSKDITERVDLVINGSDAEYVYLQNQQSDQQIDLITYQAHDENNVGIYLNIGNGRSLNLEITNRSLADLWQFPGIAYGLVSEDASSYQTRYVFADITNSEQSVEFTSLGIDKAHTGDHIDVFRIVEYNPETKEILCRIKDLPLHTTGPQASNIVISGTFRGSVSDIE